MTAAHSHQWVKYRTFTIHAGPNIFTAKKLFSNKDGNHCIWSYLRPENSLTKKNRRAMKACTWPSNWVWYHKNYLIHDKEEKKRRVAAKIQSVENHQYPDSKFHVANMGPTWGRQDPGGPHVGLMNLVIRVRTWQHCRVWCSGSSWQTQDSLLWPRHGQGIACIVLYWIKLFNHINENIIMFKTLKNINDLD